MVKPTLEKEKKNDTIQLVLESACLLLCSALPSFVKAYRRIIYSYVGRIFEVLQTTTNSKVKMNLCKTLCIAYEGNLKESPNKFLHLLPVMQDPSLGQWTVFQMARTCFCFGFHHLAHPVWKKLKSQVGQILSKQHSNFDQKKNNKVESEFFSSWFSALELISLAEQQKTESLQRISQSLAMLYSAQTLLLVKSNHSFSRLSSDFSI